MDCRLKNLLEAVLASVMKDEVEALTGAGYEERSNERTAHCS